MALASSRGKVSLFIVRPSSSGTCLLSLTTFHFPKPISSPVWDITEHLLFATIEAVEGAGASDIIRVACEDDSSSRATNNSLHHHPPWLVGTATGLIHFYDIASHKGMLISHLVTMLKPPDFIGHISLSLNLGSFSGAKDIITICIWPVVPFHRMKDAKARDAHEVVMILPSQPSPSPTLAHVSL
ncbi:hypothetical protein K503DRAFT_869716 [Rhizopogon vinicolor AM-OR11-026]|uniref:WD40 repeat-like protein n=1 Tax=Rhizopogon vinicolor AM-OR11-026 TaxID=1314800 RepID=A0A1B7MKR4_9AGAM|nr:hypothetical protein K503DRAFT_869716 [Rhizopogon vinicolor AM-OR11-026]